MKSAYQKGTFGLHLGPIVVPEKNPRPKKEVYAGDEGMLYRRGLKGFVTGNPFS